MKNISVVISPVVGEEHYRTLAEAKKRATTISMYHPESYAKAVSPAGVNYGYVQGKRAVLSQSAEWVIAHD